MQLQSVTYLAYFPAQVAAGWGEAACAVLSALADLALARRAVTLRAPVFPPDPCAPSPLPVSHLVAC